jgi:hypothetical protein
MIKLVNAIKAIGRSLSIISSLPNKRLKEGNSSCQAAGIDGIRFESGILLSEARLSKLNRSGNWETTSHERLARC